MSAPAGRPFSRCHASRGVLRHAHRIPRPPPAALPDDYVTRIQTAVDGNERVDTLIRSAAESRGLATSSSSAAADRCSRFGPLRMILDRAPVPVFTYNADELLLRRPPVLGPGSLVIASSTRGETGETARAAAGGAGGRRHGRGGHPGPAEHRRGGVRARAHPRRASRPSRCCSPSLAGRSCACSTRRPTTTRRWPRCRRAEGLPRRGPGERRGLDAIAAALHDEPVVYVLGSGPLESAAQTLAVCYLQEMQWKHAVPVGSGEFLHGSFEVVTEDLPVIVLLGEDAPGRWGSGSAASSTATPVRRTFVDAATLTLDGVEQPMRPLIGSLVVASTLLGASRRALRVVDRPPAQGPALHVEGRVLMSLVAVGDNVIDCYVDHGLMFPGGNSVNVAVHAARAGTPAAYVGAVGDDERGKHMVGALAAEGVDTVRLRILPGPTAYCRRPARRRRPGVRSQRQGRLAVPAGRRRPGFLSGFHLAHSSYCSGLEGALRDLAAWCRCRSTSTAAPAPTRMSCCRTSGWPPSPPRTSAGVSARSWCGGPAARGPSHVFATRGAEGAVCFAEDAVHVAPAQPAEITDSLGAGDAFIGRALHGLLAGEPCRCCWRRRWPREGGPARPSADSGAAAHCQAGSTSRLTAERLRAGRWRTECCSCSTPARSVGGRPWLQ